MKIESWLRTYTGRNIDPLNAKTDLISIFDIGHALSNICRFAGHTEAFYSVAQHSVLVSEILQYRGYNKTACLQGLLHDATEAYLVDIPKPIKVQSFMDTYRSFEDSLEMVIAEAFHLERLNTPEVKEADVIALATEARDLMGNPRDWITIKDVIPDSKIIDPLPPKEAKSLFFARWRELVDPEWV